MPTLEISDGQGNLNPLGELTVRAVMQYPTNSPKHQKARMDLLSVRTFQKITEDSEDADRSAIPVDPRDLRKLLELIESGVDNQDSKWFAQGLIAGRILLLLGIAARDLPKAASVNRAIGFLHKLQKGLPRRPMRMRLARPQIGKHFMPQAEWLNKMNKIEPKQSRHPLTNTSEKPLWDSWRDFKPVAHLFAAYELYRSLMISRRFGNPRIGAKLPFFFDNYQYDWVAKLLIREKGRPDFFRPDLLLTLLAEAECLRQFGVNNFSAGMVSQNRPTLDPDSTWEVPPDIQLPAPVVLASNLPSSDEFINFSAGLSTEPDWVL